MGISLFFVLCEDMILAAIPAVGFALVFNAPFRVLKYCAMLGAAGHGSRMLMLQMGLSIEMGSLLAAMLVGILGIYLSRRILAHPKVFTVAAVIPMFPGIYAYKAMIALVQLSHFGFNDALMTMLVTNFLKAAFIVGALSIGLSLPGLWLYRKKPMV